MCMLHQWCAVAGVSTEGWVRPMPASTNPGRATATARIQRIAPLCQWLPPVGCYVPGDAAGGRTALRRAPCESFGRSGGVQAQLSAQVPELDGQQLDLLAGIEPAPGRPGCLVPRCLVPCNSL